MKQSLLILWFITICGLLYLSRPFVTNTYFLGHDTVAHVTRSQAYIAALNEGQFPIRYIGWAFSGGGSSIFNHYPIGFYILVAIGTKLGLSFHTAFYGIVWVSWILIGVGLACYIHRFSSIGAWVSAVAWWLSPYAAMEIYLRAAYPELLALNWSVWLLFTLDLWLDTNKQIYLWFSTLLTTLLLITHPPTVLLFLPVVFLYLIKNYRKIPYRQLLMAGLLSFGLAAFYLIPSLGELKYLNSDELKQGYYDYQWHFLNPKQLFTGNWAYGYSNPGFVDDISFKFALGQWIMLPLLFIAAQYFWLGISIIYILISLSFTKPIWDLLPFFSYIQYPWRSLAITTLVLAVGAGLMMKRSSQKLKVIIILCLVGIVIETHSWFTPFGNQKMPQNIAQTGIESVYTVKDSDVNAVKDFPLWKAASENTNILPQRNASTNLTATINTNAPDTIIVKRWSYPGWMGYLDGKQVTLQKDPHGLISVTIPSGNHEIQIIYQGTQLQHLSNIITLISMGILLLQVYQLCYHHSAAKISTFRHTSD